MYVYFRLFDIKQQSIIIKNTELFLLLLMPLISLVPIVVVDGFLKVLFRIFFNSWISYFSSEQTQIKCTTDLQM